MTQQMLLYDTFILAELQIAVGMVVSALTIFVVMCANIWPEQAQLWSYICKIVIQNSLNSSKKAKNNLLMQS